jgi:hypothetical protein
MIIIAPLVAFISAIVRKFFIENIQMPESLYLIVSTFLFLGTGFKSQRKLSVVSMVSFWRAFFAILLLGLVNPLTAFSLLRPTDQINLAA